VVLPELPKGWGEFFMPTKADLCVQMWRQWVQRCVCVCVCMCVISKILTSYACGNGIVRVGVQFVVAMGAEVCVCF